MTAISDYLPFFNLRTMPFQLSPDPEFFFPAKPHREVLEVIKFAVGRGEGFMVLTGPAGTGKTLLLRLLIKELPENKLPAVVVTPAVSPEGLVRLLLDELEISVEDTPLDFAVLLKRLQDALIDLASAGRELLVIIDESQDLPVETIEQLRLLSNIEFDDRKIIQILLVGQSELEHVLAHPGLRQLVQRIVISETLSPLSLQETREYISFRLARAGRADLEIADSAIKILFKHTGGIPRMINRLMDRGLLMAAARGAHRITRDDIASAAATLPAPTSVPTSGPATALPRHAAPITNHPARKYLRYAISLTFSVIVAGTATWWFTGQSSHLPLFTHKSTRKALSSVTETAEEVKGPVPTPPTPHVIVTVNRALVRRGPGNRFEFISAVSSGDLLSARGKDGNWIMVDVWDAAGKKVTGWIRGDLVREIPMMEVQAR